MASSTDGTIVMYRQASFVGGGIGCPIRYKGREIVGLGRGRYAEWHVAAGRYIINNKTSSIEVSVAPGETRYVRCQVKAGLLIGRADLQIVDKEAFEEHRAGFTIKETTAGM